MGHSEVQQFARSYFATAYPEGYLAHNPKRKQQYYLNLLRRWGAQEPLMEIGCAYGAFACRAADHYKLYACDVDPNVVKVAQLAGDKGLFFCGRLPELPILPGRIRTIVCLDVLEHIGALDESLSAIHQTLTADGLLLFVLPIYDGLLGCLVQRLDKDTTHIHKHARQWWLDKAAGAGFEVLHWEGVVRYLLGGRWYVHMAGPVLRRCCSAIAVVARKVPRRV